jgi:hypothetical protein
MSLRDHYSAASGSRLNLVDGGLEYIWDPVAAEFAPHLAGQTGRRLAAASLS